MYTTKPLYFWVLYSSTTILVDINFTKMVSLQINLGKLAIGPKNKNRFCSNLTQRAIIILD